MSLEDRVHVTVDLAVRTVAEQILAEATADRNIAVSAARTQAFAEAQQAADARLAEIVAYHRVELNEALASARSEERDLTIRDVKSQMDAAAQLQIADAITSVEGRLGKVLADAQAHAADEMARAVATAHARGREAEMAGVSRLLESIRGLDGATSQAEVLDALTGASARETARAAVLMPKGDRIQGWKLSGFGSRDAQARMVDLTVADAGVVGLALTSARAVTTADAPSPVFGPTFDEASDRPGVAVPVVAGGRGMAIVYAEGIASEGHESPTPSGWPDVVEVLARHAGRCLEALAASKSIESARQKVVA